ncbi:MAG: protein kinase [Candidatus Obscuribacterales bacterium]
MAEEFSNEHRPRPVPPAAAGASAPVRPYDENVIIGSKVGDKYEILEVVGRGSMGIVYKARHELIGKIVAVKMLRWQLLSDQRSKKRFEREAIASSRLEHPNIIAIYDFGLTPSNQPYIVMDFVQGTTLLHVLRKERCMAPERAVRVFSQVADALHHAHTRGVIHRDLKPANVMLLEKNGQSDFVKVVDLGIAKIAFGEDAEPEALTKTNEVCGSPLYLSPEQCKQQPMDPRSDMYSLGIVMYELLTGVPALQGSTVYDTLYMHVHNKPKSFAEVRPDLSIPKKLEEIVFRTLEKDPGDRFPTMQDLKRELDTIFGYRHSAEHAIHVIPPEAMLSAEMVRKLKIAEGEPTPYMPIEALKKDSSGRILPPETPRPSAHAETMAETEALTPDTAQRAMEAATQASRPAAPADNKRSTSSNRSGKKRNRSKSGSQSVVPPVSTGPDTKTIILSVVSAVIATALTIGVMLYLNKPQPQAQQPNQPAANGDSPTTTVDNNASTRPGTNGKVRMKLPDASKPPETEPAESPPPIKPTPVRSTSSDTPPAKAAEPPTAPVNIASPTPPEPAPPITKPEPGAPTAGGQDVQLPLPGSKPDRKPGKVKPTPSPAVTASPSKPKPAASSGSGESGDAFFGIFQQGK